MAITPASALKPMSSGTVTATHMTANSSSMLHLWAERTARRTGKWVRGGALWLTGYQGNKYSAQLVHAQVTEPLIPLKPRLQTVQPGWAHRHLDLHHIAAASPRTHAYMKVDAGWKTGSTRSSQWRGLSASTHASRRRVMPSIRAGRPLPTLCPLPPPRFLVRVPPADWELA
jgi:hypothetical protein